jgi:hypothetical protein
MRVKKRGNYILLSNNNIHKEREMEDALRKLRMFAKYYEKDMKLHSNVKESEKKIHNNAFEEFSGTFFFFSFLQQHMTNKNLKSAITYVQDFALPNALRWKIE